jgi:hypothetical protein
MNYEFCRDPSYLPAVFILTLCLVISLACNVAQWLKRGTHG